MNPTTSHDKGTCWKVRTRQNFHDITCCRLRIGHEEFDGINRFTKIMWWNIGRHPDSNPCRPINQKVRETCRKYNRFTFCTIIVIDKIDCFFVNIAQHFKRNLAHPCFGITHGSGAVTVHRTEVTMTVNEHVAVTPPLCHPNHRFINGRITMWVIFTHNITGNTGRFFMCFIRCHTQLIHTIKNTAMYRF